MFFEEAPACIRVKIVAGIHTFVQLLWNIFNQVVNKDNINGLNPLVIHSLIAEPNIKTFRLRTERSALSILTNGKRPGKQTLELLYCRRALIWKATRWFKQRLWTYIKFALCSPFHPGSHLSEQHQGKKIVSNPVNKLTTSTRKQTVRFSFACACARVTSVYRCESIKPRPD